LYDISRVNARFFEPMLCLAVPKLPEGAEWQLELKLDGYRGIGIKSKVARISPRAMERISANDSRPSRGLSNGFQTRQ